MKSMVAYLNGLLEVVRSPKNEWLAAKITAIAIGFNMVILLRIGTLISSNPLVDTIISRICGICIWFLFGLAGLVMAIRRKIHQIITIQGNLAFFYGIVVWLFSWSLVLYMLFSLVQLLHSQ